ncbi:MAG: DUF4238 domain-containing protein, partial [Brevibacterium aurantiacum]
LEGFARDGRVRTLQLPGDKRFTQSIGDASVQSNFYSMKGHPDGEDAFEKVLSQVEGDASRVIEKINRRELPLSPSDRAMLASFLVLQVVRGPDQRRNMEHIAAMKARLEIGYSGKSNVKAWIGRQYGLEITDDQASDIWDEATQPGGPPIRLSPHSHVKQMLELLDELFPMVVGRPLSIVYFDKRSLITSDVPVSLIRERDDDDDAFEGVGFATAKGIALPISRKIGIIFGDPFALPDPQIEEVATGRFDSVQVGTTVHEKFFNPHTSDSASMWLYRHPDDERFVPADLPQPRPLSLEMIGGPEAYSGEPLFSTSTNAEGDRLDDDH